MGGHSGGVGEHSGKQAVSETKGSRDWQGQGQAIPGFLHSHREVSTKRDCSAQGVTFVHVTLTSPPPPSRWAQPSCPQSQSSAVTAKS